MDHVRFFTLLAFNIILHFKQMCFNSLLKATRTQKYLTKTGKMKQNFAVYFDVDTRFLFFENIPAYVLPANNNTYEMKTSKK